MSENPGENDPFEGSGNDPFKGKNSPWDKGQDPWAGGDLWVGNDEDYSWGRGDTDSRWQFTNEADPFDGSRNDPFKGKNSPWDKGQDPWAGGDLWVGNDESYSWGRGDTDSRWQFTNYLNYCLDPWSFTYIVAIVLQLIFVPLYALIYCICFSENNAVTKMHMFVFYINTSFWGWVIYVFFYNVLCGGFFGTNIYTIALVFVGVFGLCSCIEMCCSREGGYFRHQKTMSECTQYMNTMKETAPIHRVEIECYHYRTTTTRRKGKTRRRRRKVTTYREFRDFLYDRFVDSSDYPNLPQISMEYPIVAVESNYVIAPGDDFTLQQFDNFRRNFVEQNRYRDRYINETVSILLPGHESTVTAKSEKQNEVPWWLNCGFFYLLAVLFCSCPLRVLFRSKSKQHKFEIRKLYYLEPEGPNIGNMGVTATINVVNNQGTVNIDTNPEGIPMVHQGTSTGPMYFVQPPGQPYGGVPMQEKPGSAALYPPSTQTSYPQAPGGYQPVNTAPAAPPPYNPNMS